MFGSRGLYAIFCTIPYLSDQVDEGLGRESGQGTAMIDVVSCFELSARVSNTRMTSGCVSLRAVGGQSNPESMSREPSKPPGAEAWLHHLLNVQRTLSV